MKITDKKWEMWDWMEGERSGGQIMFDIVSLQVVWVGFSLLGHRIDNMSWTCIRAANSVKGSNSAFKVMFSASVDHQINYVR